MMVIQDHQVNKVFQVNQANKEKLGPWVCNTLTHKIWSFMLAAIKAKILHFLFIKFNLKVLKAHRDWKVRSGIQVALVHQDWMVVQDPKVNMDNQLKENNQGDMCMQFIHKPQACHNVQATPLNYGMVIHWPVWLVQAVLLVKILEQPAHVCNISQLCLTCSAIWTTSVAMPKTTTTVYGCRRTKICQPIWHQSRPKVDYRNIYLVVVFANLKHAS